MFKEVLRFQDQEVFLSYLPLSHIAGQIIDLWLSMYLGDTTWFAQPNALKVTGTSLGVVVGGCMGQWAQ